MKRILLYIFVASFFASCDKDDKAFDKTPDERIKDTLTKYQDALTGAANGWVGVVYPAGGGAYAFYFSFNKEGRVQMVSDFDSASAVDVKESSYRLKSVQQPVLIFDTYSYIHVLADPDGSVNGGDYGAGLRSDFEFAISDSSNADTIKLKGRFNGSKAWLRKATVAEKTGYLNKEFGKPLTALKGLGNILYYFKRLTTANGAVDILFNTVNHTVTISWKDSNGVTHSVTSAYYYTLTGIAFETPIVVNGQTITGISDLAWSASTSTLNGTVGGSAASVAGTNTPVAPDLNAPTDWVQMGLAADYYFYSEEGFHINGVDNALHIDTITSAVGPSIALIYWPGYGSNYDLFAPLFLNTATNGLSLQYGYAHGRTMTADGRIVFGYLGTLGTPATTGAAWQSNQQMRSTSGYYFVRTGSYSFDMVSAADSRIWITWNFPQ